MPTDPRDLGIQPRDLGRQPPGADLESWLARLADRLDLDREQRREITDEIRSHVLDAADVLQARGVAGGRPEECGTGTGGPETGGLERAEALRRAWENRGPEGRVADAIRAAHAGRGTADAIWIAALPVVLALVLRWGVLTIDGSTFDWPRLALTVPFGLFATVALVGPFVAVGRPRFAVAAWAAFWALTVLLLVGG